MSTYMRLLMSLTGLFFLMYFSLQPIMDMFQEQPVKAISEDILFVNNSGCFLRGRRSPARYSPAPEPINLLRCRKPQLMSAKSTKGANFLVPKEIPENLQCQYWVLAAKDFESNQVIQEGHFSLKRGANPDIQIGVGQQIVRVKCNDQSNATQYHDVHFFLPPPVGSMKPKPNASEKISVMVLGIDSISHMHFVRNFPQLNGFLENMHTKFVGYSRVGIDTRANLMPFLSGFSSDEANSESRLPTEAWLWESFRAAGYSTAYGEDSVEGLFTNSNEEEQFPTKSTDFFLPPVLLEMHSHTSYSLDLRETVYCTAGRQFQEVLRDFIAKLVPHMQQRPFFSFFWQLQGVQDYYEFANQLDQAYVMLFKSLQEADILNNTFLFLISDHGLRAGDYRSSFQGLAEESQPLLLAIYPDWLKVKYPQAMENFETNTHSLITPYDLRQTLMDVTRLDKLENSQLEERTKTLRLHPAESLPRGISLFLPIPEYRTCELAHIPPLFCFCRKHSEIPTGDGSAIRCSRFLVEYINQLTEPHSQCAKLKLHTVLLAYSMYLDEGSFDHELRLRVRTLPGNGEFEATVRVSDTLLLTSRISRVNQYQAQSHCVSDPHIKPLCFCT